MTTTNSDYPAPDGHARDGSDLNHPDAWCEGQIGTKIEPIVGNVFTVPEDAALVVVKAGSGEFANTIFINPVAGQMTWADTNGNFIYDPEGKDGDKDISHVIICPVLTTPTPTPTPTPTTTSTPTSSPSTTPTTSPTSTATATPSTTSTPTPSATTETPAPPVHQPILPATGLGIEVVLLTAGLLTLGGTVLRRWWWR